MALLPYKSSYQVPRGKLMFDPIDDADQFTGYRRFGNCPSSSIAIDAKMNPHYSSESGPREKDGESLSEIVRTLDLECDNFSTENLALWLTGSVETKQQAAGPAAEEMLEVLPGRIYQLGISPTSPTGARKVSNVTVTSEDGLTTYDLTDDYVLDADLAMLQITEKGAITQKTKVKVNFSKVATTWNQVKSGNSGSVRGRLQIIADNAAGVNRDIFLPLVTIKPDGNLPLIQDGQDYIKMKFKVEILKAEGMEAIYIDGRPSALP